MPKLFPSRLVCLSAESADWMVRLGAWSRVVGVTSYFKQPARQKQVAKVSGFSVAHVERIKALRPDLVITFSDVQSEITAQLVKSGIQVLATNQRSIAQIRGTLEMMARLVGREARGVKLLEKFDRGMRSASVKRRPRVYFEEWNEPLVSGICWVSEMIEAAGGEDIFKEFRERPMAKERCIDADEVVKRNPDLIFASWCGKPVDFNAMRKREGWDQIEAVKRGALVEIPGEECLQPGYGLVKGVDRMRRVMQRVDITL